jgi:hypothetical protein
VDHLRPDFLDAPLPARLPPEPRLREQILTAHRRSVELGLSMYVDPLSGLSVMTAAYLAERGYCCSSRCRHCPYEP